MKYWEVDIINRQGFKKTYKVWNQRRIDRILKYKKDVKEIIIKLKYK